MEKYLRTTPTIQSDSAAVINFAKKHAKGNTPIEQAVSLYYAVRDGFRYDPFSIDMSLEGFSAEYVLEQGRGWCVPKAVLLAACCRALNIPARLGFADVTNHLSTEKLRDNMKTDIFYWHGYTSIFLDGKWVKATPAFNLALCEKFGLKPLEFNGREDSLYHEFDNDGNRHMEYLNDRGEFADLPYDDIVGDFKRYYPGVDALKGESFDREVEKEITI